MTDATTTGPAKTSPAVKAAAHALIAGTRNLLITKGWTKGLLARTKEQTWADWRDDQRAACYCLAGAMRRTALALGALEPTGPAPDPDSYTYTEDAAGEAHELVSVMVDITTGQSMGQWNDAPQRTLDDVLALLDRIEAKL